MRTIIRTDDAPKPIGPYSQAVVCKGMVYCSGQVGIDPRTGTMVPGGAAEQTRQCLTNLGNVLKAAGSGLEKVVRCTVFVTDLGEFQAINQVYAEFFNQAPPSRTTIQVAKLPAGAAVEIDAIAEA